MCSVVVTATATTQSLEVLAGVKTSISRTPHLGTASYSLLREGGKNFKKNISLPASYVFYSERFEQTLTPSNLSNFPELAPHGASQTVRVSFLCV